MREVRGTESRDIRVETKGHLPIRALLASSRGFTLKPEKRSTRTERDWSGRRESNPYGQFGKLELYH